MAKMQDYFKYNSYFSLFTKEKGKEVVWGHVAFIAYIFTSIISILIYRLYYVNQLDAEKMTNTLSTLCISIAPGLIGLLGFLITGVSLLAVLITDKAIEALEKKGIVESFVEVLFSFYYAGSLIGIGIFLLIVNYILLQYSLDFETTIFIPMLVITAYICSYSMLYTIGLLGSCINTFFANVALIRDCEKSQENPNDHFE